MRVTIVHLGMRRGLRRAACAPVTPLYMQALYQLMSGCWWVCHGPTSRRERLVCEAVGAGQGEAHALRNGTHQA